MMVIFVSQCEKKALKRTRRVLDSFANRIGDNTWQTIITKEGLEAVRKLLRKTASKSTAVSCHWIRSRSRSELLWIVGNKRKFNHLGEVPVHYTENSMEKYMDMQGWKTLNVINHATAIAGLFHDIGKATVLFQDKIDPEKATESYEPYRHEWVSFRMFQAFVGSQTDDQWLISLMDIQLNAFDGLYKDGRADTATEIKLSDMPPFAQLVAWLILTHHKLPLYPAWKENNPPSIEEIDKWLENYFSPLWNSPNCKDAEQQNRIEKNWEITDLPVQSMHWRSKACELASKARVHLSEINERQNWLHQQLFTTHLSRLCLTLADHYYSSLTLEEMKKIEHQQWRNPNYWVYANTDKIDGKKRFKQQLDEHLIGVAHFSEKIVKALPRLNSSMISLEPNDELAENVGFSKPDKEKKKWLKEKFGWQDKARKLTEKIAGETGQYGFFGINMASTGKGKTRANAKIMTALGLKTGRLRFSVALGLRVLTLQTGKEYRDELKLTDEDLAIAVGGAAVRQLFEYRQDKEKSSNTSDTTLTPEESGSESREEWLDSDISIHYLGDIVDHSLAEWTKKQRGLDELISAPVLVCTIDHLISATEGTKGGKQIPATLRLLTSDLVLDEPDDFGLSDLPALSRLVHWAGLLGSRVLLSTATIPPAMAYALFQAYHAGWAEYAKANIDGWNKEIVCAWFDENDCTDGKYSQFEAFKEAHEKFVKKRVEFLKRLPVKRKAEILSIQKGNGDDAITALASAIQNGILSLHQDHGQEKDGKRISIGLVRMANIDPMVAVAKKLLEADVPETMGEQVQLHYCIYHSRYPLAVRADIEEKLDRILNRKKPDKIWAQPEISQAIHEEQNSKHHIFIVLASPVAEVGRDHDYDWAIVEPSSMRSIIQLAGRVLRHREIEPANTNILILSQNYKALKGKEICFNRPGFESGELKLNSHDLCDILGRDQYQSITAIHRIFLPEEYCKNNMCLKNLALFEHRALAKLFYAPAKVWWKNHPHWCGEVQRQQRFRDSKKDEAYYLWLEDEYRQAAWRWKNETVYPAEFGVPLVEIKQSEVHSNENSQFWFNLDTLDIYKRLANHIKIDLSEVSRQFGEVRIVSYDDNGTEEYSYHPSLGLYRDLEE